MEAIGKADTIKGIHIAHRQVIRGGADPLAANTMRDEAIKKLQQQQQSTLTSSMLEAQEVMPNVFLGPFSVARDAEKLQKLGITHVVCLSAEGTCELNSVKYLEHPLVEVECTLERGAEQIATVIPSCVDFIRHALSKETEGNNVLIHCLYGKTRSAAVASCARAILLREGFDEAYERIKKKRDVFVPVEWHERLQAAVNEGNLPNGDGGHEMR